jgi:DNA helicase II / ATP-dependent DNA helicase PcrA
VARLFDLNTEQLEAVRAIRGPVLILAGAGTGKTRVITTRTVYLLHEGIAPERILAVTFTNKAASEMRQRVAAMTGHGQASKLTISTFHSLCVRILRQDIDKLGYKKNFSIYPEGDQLGLIRKIIPRLAAKDEKLDPLQARNLISKAKNQHLVIDEKTLAGAVFQRYQENLKGLNAVDFDDLLILAVRLLDQFNDVRGKWQTRFRYLMVDEFQDTNKQQLELVRLLAGAERNVCVVGDDDQSIYGWRGAEVSNILEFEHHFPGPKILKLEQNYRSTNAILGAANSLIRLNPRRRPKSLWSSNGEGSKVKIVQVPDDREEASYVVNEIQRLQLVEGAHWNEIAVIFRMNAQSRLLEENFRRLQIPYRVVGGRSFFERREVKDLLAYLTCMMNPDDDTSLLRIINTPARGIGSSTIELAIEESVATKRSLFQVLQHASSSTLNAFGAAADTGRASSDRRQRPADLLSQRAKDSISKFLSLVDRYETKLTEPMIDLSAVVSDLLAEIGYFDDLRRSCKTPEEAADREENVRELVRALSEYQRRSTDGIPGFLAEVSLDQERDEEKEAVSDGVTLITFHAAKGLEFTHVYLIGIEEGLLPHDRSKLEGNLDEERRLFYVGITRAKYGLTITHCGSRIRYGNASPCHPSSFLKDLDPRFVEQVNYHELMNRPATETTAKLHFAKMKELLG